MPFENIEDLSFLVKCMKKPQRYPHVSVYHPRNARFNEFDIIIVVYKIPGHADFYGYQLKEGIEIPMEIESLGKLFKSKKNILVRGKPAQSEGLLRNWTLPSEEQNASFLGASGRHWTPSAWRKMQERKKVI
jgi:hypothetical protein